MVVWIYFLIFLIVSFCIGIKIIRLFKLRLTRLDEFLISIATGTGIVMYLVFFLGIFGFLYKDVYLGIAAIVVVFSLKEVAYFANIAKFFSKDIVRKIKPNLLGIIVVILLFLLTINLITVFAPVYEWDPVAYHLAFANNYNRHHTLAAEPSQKYDYMPHGMSLIFTISESFVPGTLSVLIVYFLNALAGIGIYSIVKKNHSEISAVIAALIFLSLPAIMHRIALPMVDLSLTFFFLCVIILFLKYIEEINERVKFNLMLALSFLMGVCLFIKFTGMFLVLPLVIGILFDKLVYKKKHPLRHIIIMAVILLVLISPWIIRSYILTENPVYPYGYTIFGGMYLEGYLSNLYSEFHEKMGLEKNIANIVMMLWNITFRSHAFEDILGISPFYIAIIPLVLFFYKEVKNTREWVILLVIAFTIMIITFLVVPLIRYLFPALALLSVLIGKLIDAIIEKRALRWAIIISLIISLVFSYAIWWGINSKNVKYILSSQTKEDYYSGLKDANPYAAMQWINKNTPANSKVFLSREVRGYYLNRDYVISDPTLIYIDFYSMTRGNELTERLKQLNVSYILINEGSMYKPELGYFYNKSWAITKDAISNNVTMLYNGSRIIVYRID